MAEKLTYKDSGVDVSGAGQFVQAIGGLMHRTFGPRVMELNDGFAGLFALSDGGMLTRRYKNPVLAACTDGVGTKLKIAFLMDKHDTVGIDLSDCRGRRGLQTSLARSVSRTDSLSQLCGFSRGWS